MNLIYLLYDSINNLIFASQVWNMLVNIAKQNPNIIITIVSFETHKIEHHYEHKKIKIIQIKRYRYLGSICLWLDLIRLKKYLSQEFNQSQFIIIARGPFTGWIAQKLNITNCQKITIQARGLLAEEYAYSNNSNNFFKKILFNIRYLQFFNLEKKTYNPKQNIIIECVSPALKQYLIKIYGVNQLSLTIAQNDFPNKINPKQLLDWRKTIRKKLNIKPTSTVYCYSGSTHKWQCPQDTIKFFQAQLRQDANIFLLILTSQPEIFDKLIQYFRLPSTSYLITSANRQEIYQYLAAADFGLLFREAHIINWVSRPTKALEYQSAGLKIIHNNTIAWLVNK